VSKHKERGACSCEANVHASIVCYEANTSRLCWCAHNREDHNFIFTALKAIDRTHVYLLSMLLAQLLSKQLLDPLHLRSVWCDYRQRIPFELFEKVL
jgi:hypothetical protein